MKNDDTATCIVLVVGFVGVLLVAITFWGFIIWAVTQALRSLGVQF